MNQRDTTDKKESDILEFVVTNNQLIGEPWKATDGEMMQNILFADGWFMNRPVKKLHAAENNKVKFYLSKRKKDGSVNEITLRRNFPSDEADEKGKPKYMQKKIAVPVEELPAILDYAREKYKFKKAQELKSLTNVKKETNALDEFQESERFSLIDLGCSKYAIKDNMENVFLKDEDKEPYCFTSNQMAQMFVNKANGIARDGLSIRMYKEKEYALCRVAVQTNGFALAFIKRQTMDLIMDAINQNPNAIVLVSDEYKAEAVAMLPELIFNKLLRGEVAQDQVINYLFALDNKADYSISIVGENGKIYEIKAEDIGTSEIINKDGSCAYTAHCNEGDISFTNKDIGEVQYNGFTAAFFTTSTDKEHLNYKDDFTHPRHKHAKVI